MHRNFYFKFLKFEEKKLMFKVDEKFTQKLSQEVSQFARKTFDDAKMFPGFSTISMT